MIKQIMKLLLSLVPTSVLIESLRERPEVFEVVRVDDLDPGHFGGVVNE